MEKDLEFNMFKFTLFVLLIATTALTTMMLFEEADGATPRNPIPFPPERPIAANTDPDFAKHTELYVEGYYKGYELKSPKKVEQDYQKGWRDGQDDRMDGKENKFEDGVDTKNRWPKPPTKPIDPIQNCESGISSPISLERFPKPIPKPDADDLIQKPPFVNKPHGPIKKDCIPIPPVPPTTPDSSDPLMFGHVEIDRVWPEWHESRKTQFDLFSDGNPVTLSRDIKSGYSLFVDFDRDGQKSSGQEWMFGKNVYENLKILDSNNNGFFDYDDEYWSLALVEEYTNDGSLTIHTPYELEILGFNYSEHKLAMHDMHGERQYSDCLYEGKYHYPQCVKVSETHFAIVSYNLEGVLYYGGNVEPTFGIFISHIEN